MKTCQLVQAFIKLKFAILKNKKKIKFFIIYKSGFHLLKKTLKFA